MVKKSHPSLHTMHHLQHEVRAIFIAHSGQITVFEMIKAILTAANIHSSSSHSQSTSFQMTSGAQANEVEMCDSSSLHIDGTLLKTGNITRGIITLINNLPA